MVTKINDKLYSWASDLESQARLQAERTSRLPIIAGHVALMPDAHWGMGATVGSVIPTTDAIIPAAVGVDIGCFTGDTLVPLADGKDHRLDDLADRNEPFVVWGIRGKDITAAWATARRTRLNAPLLAVTLDNGKVVRCTPDHEFLLRDGTYRRADQLGAGTSLMPFNAYRCPEGYLRIRMIGERSRNQVAHWVIARAGLLGPIPAFDGQRTVIHHRNFQEDDNRPENLQFMGDGDHAAYHRSLVERNTYWQSDDFEAARLAALRAKAETPEGHAFYAARGTANIVRYMEERREHFLDAVAGNGERGAKYLARWNQSDEGRAKARETHSRVHDCPFCGQPIKSYGGMRSHLRTHGHTGPFKHLLVNNHKVVAVERLEEREDVFCLTVPATSNFALSAGVFVHNCGMSAVKFSVTASDLPDELDTLLGRLAARVPSGVGRGHDRQSSIGHRTGKMADTWATAHPFPSELAKALWAKKGRDQFGTLGAGNHFLELCLDEADGVWLVLHSGSRGIGNELAKGHIATARTVAKRAQIGLEDPDLAYLLEGTPEFEAYIADLLWAQAYAAANRDAMLDNAIPAVLDAIGTGREVERIKCHHNYTVRETHEGRDLWVTRKGAIRAGVGDLGIIPGSMGTSSFIVEGLGSALSYESCSHGAGRRFSRNAAKKQLSVESLNEAMGDRAWLRGDAKALLDEHPAAYKDIESVMADQADLVTMRHRLIQVLNLKGL